MDEFTTTKETFGQSYSKHFRGRKHPKNWKRKLRQKTKRSKKSRRRNR